MWTIKLKNGELYILEGISTETVQNESLLSLGPFCLPYDFNKRIQLWCLVSSDSLIRLTACKGGGGRASSTYSLSTVDSLSI